MLHRKYGSKVNNELISAINDGLLKHDDTYISTNQYGTSYIDGLYPSRVSVISLDSNYWCAVEGNYVRVYEQGSTTKAINKTNIAVRVCYY